MKYLYFAFVLLNFLAMSCTSFVYSPALSLSESQVRGGKFEIKGGVAGLPESSPDNVNKKVSFCVLGEIGLGLSDNININIGGFTEPSEFNRGGVSFSSRIRLFSYEKSEILTFPKTEILFDGGSRGYGLEIPFIYLHSFSQKFYSYYGLGFAYGFDGNNKKQQNNQGISKYREGYGIIGHIGLGWNFEKNVRLILELNPIYQINVFDDKKHFLISPTLMVGLSL